MMLLMVMRLINTNSICRLALIQGVYSREVNYIQAIKESFTNQILLFQKVSRMQLFSVMFLEIYSLP